MVKEQKIESSERSRGEQQQNISPEQAKPVEQGVEVSLDSTKIEQTPQPKVQEKSDSDQMAVPVVIPEDKVQQTPATSEVIHKKVEDVLSIGMDNVFLSLDAETQKEFKIKGEEVSKKITEILLQAKIKAGKITKLILEWLRIIPKVNKHYIEQEAKIKTEKILKINQAK